MTTSNPVTEITGVSNVKVTGGNLVVQLRDGRVLSVPVAWYPRLAEGTPAERRQWELIGPGIGIHWPALDEDISVEALLRGFGSNETPASLHRWRESRRQPATKPLRPTRRARKPAQPKRPSRATRG